jgi:hypothetical protein
MTDPFENLRRMPRSVMSRRRLMTTAASTVAVASSALFSSRTIAQPISTKDAIMTAEKSADGCVLGLDHDDIGSNPSDVVNVIDLNS